MLGSVVFNSRIQHLLQAKNDHVILIIYFPIIFAYIYILRLILILVKYDRRYETCDSVTLYSLL